MAINCPFKKSKAYQDLVAVVGENSATALWVNFDGLVPDRFYEGRANLEAEATHEELAWGSIAPKVKNRQDKSTPYPNSLKGVEALPLAGNEAVYKHYNLLNEAGKIKEFKNTSDALDWVDFNNTHANYQFALREDNYGKKHIYIIPRSVDKTGQTSIGFQLTSTKPTAEKIDELDSKLIQLLSNLGVEVKQYNKFKKKYGVDAIAMFEIVNGIAKIKVDFSNANELTLPEETAHFIIETMGDSVLGKRILELMRANDYYKSVLGENYDAYYEAYDGDDTKLIKEAAGQVLSQAIVSKFKQDNLNIPDGLLGILTRFWNYVRELYKRISQTELNKAINDAYGNVANEFMQGNSSFMSAITLPADIRLFQISDSALNGLKTKITTARDASAKRLDIYRRKGIKRTEAFEKISLNKVEELLDKKEYVLASLSIAESARHMFTHVTGRLKELEKSIQNLSLVGDDALQSLASALKSMKSFNDSYLPMLKDIQNEMYGLSIDDVENEDYKKVLEIVSEVRSKAEYVDSRYLDMAMPLLAKRLLSFLAGGPITEENIIESMKHSGEDITWIQRFTDSMAMSGKPMLQLIDILVKDTKQQAKDESYESIKDLIAAHMEMEKAGVKNTTFMYEKKKDGTLSGNTVEKYNNGDLQDARELEGKKILDTIRKANKNIELSSDDKEIITQIQGNEILSEQYKRMWSYFYRNNMQKRPDAERLIKEMQSMLGKDEYEDWFEDNVIRSKTTGEVVGYKGDLSIPAEKYRNKQYDEIQANTAMKKYYDLATKLKEDHDGKLVKGRKLGSLAPQIRTDAIQKIKKSTSTKDFFHNISEMFREATSNVEDETELGDRFKITDENDRPVYFLPIHYTTKIKNVKDLSTDFTESLASFIVTSNDFHYMNKIIDILEIGRDVISASEVLEYDSNGNPLKQSIDIIGKKLMKTVKSDTKASNLKARTDAYYKMVIYGQARSEGKDFTVFGKKFNSEKLIDLLGKNTSLANLALNIYAGIQNPLIGNANIRIEAISGQFINNKNLLVADGKYAKDLPKNLMNLGSRNVTDFMSLFGEKLEVMQNFSRHFKELDMDQKGILEKVASGNSLYVTSGSGEHQLQYRLAYALADARKLKDADGKDITLLDGAFDIVNNKLILKKGLKNVDGTPFNEASLRAHKRVQNAINNAMHGIYNDIDLLVMQQDAILRQTLMFRKFIKPGYNRRWRKPMYDYERQTYIEGYYRTFGKFMSNALYEHRKIQFEFAANWDKLTPMQKQNMFRAMADISYIVSLNALIWFVLPMLGGDDEDDWVGNMTAYQINRLLTEMTFFSDPRQIVTLIKSPMASLDQVNRNINLILTLANPWFAAEEITRGKWKGYHEGTKALYTTLPLVKSVMDWSTPGDKRVFQKLQNK